MKLTGKEKAVITVKKNDYSLWDIFEANIDDLININILNDIKRWQKVEKSGKKFKIFSLSIDSLNITQDTYISLKFSISKKSQKNTIIKKVEYKITKCYDFYNTILELCNDGELLYNLSIDDIYIKLNEIEVYPALAFTNVGFINSDVLNQYDLDGQILFLEFLLRNTHWNFRDKKIIFPSLYDEIDINNFMSRYTLETKINLYNQQLQVVNSCEINGILETKKDLETKIDECKKENKKLHEEYILRNSIFII